MPSSIHIFYRLGPYARPVCVIYQNLGYGQVSWFFEYADQVTPEMLLGADTSIFKIPPGHIASFQLDEVTTGQFPQSGGKFITTFTLDPNPYANEAEAQAALAELKERDTELESPRCISFECPDGVEPCSFGEVARKVDGVCQCVPFVIDPP